MIKIAIYISIICLSIISASAQEMSKNEAKEVLLKIAKNYQQEGYILSYTKKIYESVGQSKPMNEVKGRFILGENHQYRVEEKGTLIIQNKEVNIVVDSSANEVFLSNTDEDFMPVEIGSFLNDSIYDMYSFEIRKLTGKNQLTIRSKFDVTSYLEMVFNSKSYQITSFNYYLPKGNYFSESMEDETEESPVMMMTYAPIEKIQLTDDHFSTQDWLSSKKGRTTLKDSQSEYQLYDLRPQSY